jgi:tetratricopeptide (TPR) repeat protein
MKHIVLTILIILNNNLIKAQDGVNLIALGNKEMNEGNFKQAEKYYGMALTKEPQNWHIYTLLGFSFYKQNLFNKADSFYNITLSNDSNQTKTYWYKGLNLIKLKKDSLAILSYKKFILKEKNGSHVEAYKQISKSYERILRRTGLNNLEIDDLIHHLSQILILDPSAPEAPQILNFIESIKSKRPINLTGKWKLES